MPDACHASRSHAALLMVCTLASCSHRLVAVHLRMMQEVFKW